MVWNIIFFSVNIIRFQFIYWPGTFRLFPSIFFFFDVWLADIKCERFKFRGGSVKLMTVKGCKKLSASNFGGSLCAFPPDFFLRFIYFCDFGEWLPRAKFSFSTVLWYNLSRVSYSAPFHPNFFSSPLFQIFDFFSLHSLGRFFFKTSFSNLSFHVLPFNKSVIRSQKKKK